MSTETRHQTNVHICTSCYVLIHGVYTVCAYIYVCVCVCVYLHPHVRQDDAAGHPALGGGASEPLKVLVHAVLPERRLNCSRCTAGHKLAPVLPLQHLHLLDSTAHTGNQSGIGGQMDFWLILESDIDKVVLPK